MALSSDDKIAIAEVIARYNLAFDTGDVDGLVQTFLPDGVFDGLFGVFTGAKEIGAFLEWHWTNPELAQFQGSQHWVTNLIIEEVTDGHARSSCYGTVISRGSRNNSVLGAWHYHDEFRQVSSGWKFAKRHVRAFEPQPPFGASTNAI